jgi:membrane fusion protein, adhesin transport system
MTSGIPTGLTKILRASGARSDPMQRLIQPLALEDGRTPRLLSRTIATISVFILVMIAWGALCKVREISFAPGQIIPKGQIQNVSHLEGGIVAELLAREGDRVVERQPLVRLEPVAAASDLEQLEVRRAALILQITRLDAESRGTMPDFGKVGAAYPELARQQVKLYAGTMDQQKQERITLVARLAQRREEVVTSTVAVETAKAQVPLARELLEIQSKLIPQGYTPLKIYLEAKSALVRVEGELAMAETKLQTAVEARSEAESALAAVDTSALQKIADERAKASNELAEIEQQIAKSSDRLERMLVRAPSTGLVQEIIPKAPGEVIKPGELVARIVPSGNELVAEVRIDTKDSGYVSVGSRAEIKFATYDSALFGTLPGVVEHISATTFQPQPGQPLAAGQAVPEPYYKAIIRLSSDHVGAGPTQRQISPGMAVQASIVSGSKSIMRYLLKPVFNSLDVAFTER